jgi:hypothetical protein
MDARFEDWHNDNELRATTGSDSMFGSLIKSQSTYPQFLTRTGGLKME